MKKGDLVKVKEGTETGYNISAISDVGVVLDEYEDMAPTHYEVQFTYIRGWFAEDEIQLLSES